MDPAPSVGASRVLFAGRTTLDVLYRLDRFPEEDTKVYAADMRTAAGGPATNAAATHALLGGTSLLLSAIGGGPLARPVREQLEQCGIQSVDLAAGTAYETPLVTVLLNTARATRTAVNPPLTQTALPKLPPAWNPLWGEMPRMILADGFHLEQTLGLFAACHRTGAALCLDGGSWKPGTDELAPLLTAAICSERFAVPGREGDAEAALAWFADRGVPFIAITRGAKPILAVERGRRFEIEVEEIDAVDTLGAGDVLHGAFCYYFLCTNSFEGALRQAAHVATLSCKGLGVHCWTAGWQHR
jgi:sugar/nucleoside kinase (ribokinase family)